MKLETLSIRRERVLAGIFVLGVAVLYFLSFPGNRHENDDGYSYAYAIRGFDYGALLNSRYLLFLPFSKAVFFGLSSIGLHTDPYMLMCILSLIFSMLTLFIFYFFLRKILDFPVSLSFLSCGLLACMYGYWRYSVEAEVYSVSHFLVLCTLFLLAEYDQKNKPFGRLILAALVGGLAVLFYKPNFIPVFLAFSFLPLFRKDFKGWFVYLAAGALVIVTGYFLGFLYATPNTGSFVSFLTGGSSITVGNPLLSFFVTGSDIVAANFIYGFHPLVDLIHRRFPANMIEEEVMAAGQNGILNYVALLTLLSLIVAFIVIVFMRFKRAGRGMPDSLTWIMILWVAIYSLVLGVLDPGSPEPWLMILMPLLVLFVYLVVYPLYKSKGSLLPAYIFTALLFFHNLVAGYNVIRDKNYDYNYYQTRWFIKHAQKNDLIVTLGSYTSLQYILYFSKASACSPEHSPDTWLQKIQRTSASGHSVYFDEDFLHPRDVVKYRSPEIYQEVEKFIAEHPNQIRPCTLDEQEGRAYKLAL